MKTTRGSLISYGVAFLIVVSTGFAALHAQDIQDWWRLRTYTPSAEIAQLAERTKLSTDGKEYFYVSSPALDTKEDFNKHCPTGEQTIVLGCYAGGKIYVLDVDDKRLDGIEEVTAAHEMLHAAYDRLGDEERKQIDELLQKQLLKIKDARILSLVSQYREQDAESINNEMHSIFGTEYGPLMPELEQYYARYFNDRKAVVRLSRDYESVFTRLEKELQSLTNRIEQLIDDIDHNKILADRLASEFAELQEELKSLSSQLDAIDSQLDNLEDQGRTSEYNQRVQSYNALVAQYNATAAELKSIQNRYNNLAAAINGDIKTYNVLIKRQKALTYQGEDLYHAIDSTYQEL